MTLLLDAYVPPSYLLLTAFLGGSAFSVFISKLFDLYQTKNQHRLSLQKEFFTRKLQVYEKTVIFWTNTYGIMHGFEMAFRSLMNPDHHADDEISDDVMQAMIKSFNDINDESKVLASSLSLYADIPLEYQATHEIVECFNTFKEIGKILNSCRNGMMPEEEFRNNAMEKIDKLSALVTEIRKKADALAAILRDELEEFKY